MQGHARDNSISKNELTLKTNNEDEAYNARIFS